MTIRLDPAGTLQPGDKLPSIAELGEQYKPVATPIKRALWILDERGWIEVHQGKGSFVAQNRPPDSCPTRGFRRRRLGRPPPR